MDYQIRDKDCHQDREYCPWKQVGEDIQRLIVIEEKRVETVPQIFCLTDITVDDEVVVLLPVGQVMVSHQVTVRLLRIVSVL